MPTPEGLTPELKTAWENAWSYPGSPPGSYIGRVITKYTIFYFYQDGNKYWFETEYSRNQRKQKEERRKRQRQQYENKYGGYYRR